MEPKHTETPYIVVDSIETYNFRVETIRERDGLKLQVLTINVNGRMTMQLDDIDAARFIRAIKELTSGYPEEK